MQDLRTNNSIYLQFLILIIYILTKVGLQKTPYQEQIHNCECIINRIIYVYGHIYDLQSLTIFLLAELYEIMPICICCFFCFY